MNEQFELVKINREEFTKHHDECLAVADELWKVFEKIAPLHVTAANEIFELANRLDKSISKLPARFD